MLTVEKLKKLLGLPMVNEEDSSSDTVLQFILDDVTETILNYCQCEEVPEGLENTAYRMAIDLYRNENVGSEETSIGSVTSIREGDIQTSFASCVDENFRNTLLKNYTAQLNRFRKIAW